MSETMMPTEEHELAVNVLGAPRVLTIVTQVKSNRVVYFTDDADYLPPTDGDWYYVSSTLGDLPKGMSLRNCWRWRFNGGVFTDAGAAARGAQPAALALLGNFYVFHSGQSWWGALSETTPLGVFALIATGVGIADRVGRMPGALSFLGGYYLLYTLTAFLGDPARAAGAFRPPDLNAALFFAFFMVTDPPTSPPRHRDQIIYGLIVAGLSYAIFAATGAIYFLIAALLVTNLWEALRRSRLRSRH